MGEDFNNSSLNNLFGHFLNVQLNSNETYNFDDVPNMVSIDTSNHRIGINTLDPVCSLDISGTDGKIIVNTISCTSLDVSNASITSLDISGTLDLSSNRGKLNIFYEDNSGSLKAGELYYNSEGFVKIKTENGFI